MKKILLSSNTFFALHNFRYELMKELESKNYEVICLGSNDSSKKKILENGWKTIDLKMDRRGTNPINDFKLLLKYIKIYKKEKPDYIFHYTIKPNIYGSIAAKILGIPTINNVTGLGDIFNGESLVNKLVKILYKIAFRFPKKVFFQNDDDMNLFLENKLIQKKICGRLPGSGVDLNKFRPMEKTEKNDEIIFLYLGRISENKGLIILNEVSKKIFEENKNVEFRLLGKIYEDELGHVSKEELRTWGKESNIKYMGTSKDVREQIRNADCIIFPSFYREGVPRSLIESAAMGKPIITTNNVGCKDIVKNGYNGFLSEPRDIQGMVKNIEKFLKLSNEEKEQMGANGRKKTEEEFDVKIVIKKYLETIK